MGWPNRITKPFKNRTFSGWWQNEDTAVRGNVPLLSLKVKRAIQEDIQAASRSGQCSLLTAPKKMDAADLKPQTANSVNNLNRGPWVAQ